MVNNEKICDGFETSDCEDASLSYFSLGDYHEAVPAAGYRNGADTYNAESNGNYWSATPNESDTQNAYNLNFNSGNRNTNWNNRNNGHSVRPVSELTSDLTSDEATRHFSISREQLLRDLFQAYKDARSHKRGRRYQLSFEFNLEDNLVALRDELYRGDYRPRPATCFIIHDPKMREVFAAEFRDRIVHHLFYNYTHELFERTFIYDTYSCIKGRGTHFGVNRLKHHIVAASKGYSRECYVLKLDIRGYFMNINRERLLCLCRHTLFRRRKELLVDYRFVDYLLETIICTDPVDNCRILGNASDWNNLPTEKSLFHSASGRGLPIGNLSSQLFSNIYMNVFDQYMKRELKCKHYGRYVDDAYIVATSAGYLKSLIPIIEEQLEKSLGLSLSKNKVQVYNVKYGVEFLGAYLKPFRTYVSSVSLRRMSKKVRCLSMEDVDKLRASVNSFLGVLSHRNSYCIRRVLWGNNKCLCALGRFDRLWLRYQPSR